MNTTKPPTEIGSDYGEPEDNSFRRDWKWVPVKLNELADENAQLRTRISELEAGLEHALSSKTADDWFSRLTALRAWLACHKAT